MPLPAGTRRLGDFEAVALALGGNLWIAGGLLGVIPHSADGGVTWKLQPAPAGGGIHALVAIDANTLLAGGDGGRIWRSGDAGATWQLLRGRGQTDVLFILAPGDTGPYPAIAAHGRAGLNVAVLYAASPAGEGYPSDQPLRAAAAAAGAAGVCVLGDFASLAGLAPLQPPTEAQVLRAWSASLDSPAERELLRQLTAAIRLYRPAVLAVGPSGPGSLGEKAQSRLIARVALKAADEAADTSAAPELVAVGLNPWKVERIFVGDEENDRCAAPWEPAAPPKATPQASGGAPPTATVLIDSGAIPEGAAGPLELLAQDAIWRLPWAGLLDRPAHITAYTCAGLTGTPRLFTTALAGPHALATSAPTPQQRKLISSAGLRLAAAANRTAPLVQELAAVMENPDSPPTALLAADRMLLVRARLLAEGKFAQADEALTLFLKHGQGHPLYSQVNVETLALSASSLWKGQLARMGMPPSSQAADLPKALKSFGDWSLWSESPWGAMVYAAALARTGRAVESPAIWRRMINGPYAPGWRRAANLELSLATRGALDAEGRNVAAAAFTAERGTIDGRLNEPIWQDARVYRLATSPTGAAASEPAAAALTPSFQILRTPTHVVAAIRLPAAPRRQWQFSWAVDSGRDGWTQFVITADTAGHRRAEILSRLGPPATCEDGSYMIGGQSSPDEFTFELAVAIADLGADPAVGGVWNFQLRADATDSDSPQTFFFQPQADGATEPQRYGLLVVPPPGR